MKHETQSDIPGSAPPTVRWIEMFEGRPADGQRVLLADEDGRVFIGHRGHLGAYFNDEGYLIKARPMRWWALIPPAPRTGEQK